MKKIICTCTLLIFCTCLFAQYKKASFFGKEGRTYGLGAQFYSMGDGKGSVLGYNLSFGREQEGKRLFNWWEIRMIPSYEFSYESKDYNDNTVKVRGTTKTQFVYGVSYGFYLLPNEEEQIFKPYLTAGLSARVFGGIKSPQEDDLYDIKRQPSERNFNIGLGGGVGSIINIGGNFSLKLEGGYTYVYNYDENTDPEYKKYFLYTSHPYASAGIRYRLVQD